MMARKQAPRKPVVSTRSPVASGRPLWRSRRAILLALLLLVLGLAWAQRASLPNSLARHYLSQRREERAWNWLQVSRRLAPRDAESRFLTARIFRRRGQLMLADEQLRLAEGLGWPDQEIQRERVLGEAQWGQLARAAPHLPELLAHPGSDGAEICQAFATAYIKSHDFDSARRLISVWMQDFPQDPLPHYLLGTIYHEHDNWGEAMRNYERALALDPRHGVSALALADCLVTTKEPTKALAWYGRAAEILDDPVPARIGQAHCFRELGETEQARRLLEALLQSPSPPPQAILEWAQLQNDEGQFAAALERLEPLAAQDPHHWELQFVYATSLRGVGRTEEAGRLFEQISEARNQLIKARRLADSLSAQDAETRWEIGRLHLAYGHPREAVWWLQTVLDLDPGHAAAHAALAEYYAGLAQRDARYAGVARKHREQAEAASSVNSEVASPERQPAAPLDNER